MGNEELLQAIYDKVSSTETKVAVIEERLSSVADNTNDHEKRLRSVEKKVWLVTGTGIGISWLIQKVVRWGGG